MEQGGNVVQTYGGKYKLRRGHGYSGDAYDPDWHDVGSGETLAGVAHTHPTKYDHETFGDVDIENMVDEEQPLKLLRSGPLTYVIARTREFDARVRQAEESDTTYELKHEIGKTYNDAVNATKGSWPEQLEAGVIAVCRAFRLVYYEGKGSELARVPTGVVKK
jgi:hypothetical protein